MNDTPELPDERDITRDHELIARLRTALDEVAAARPTVADVESPLMRAGVGTARWVAIAAAVALVAAGATALAVRHDPPGANPPTVAPNPSPTTVPTPTTATVGTSPTDTVETIVDALRPAPLPTSVAGDTSAGPTLTGVVNIADVGHGPMITLTRPNTMMSPQELAPVAGFDWGMVTSTTDSEGTTWSDTSVTITGTWDGTTFHLTQRPTQDGGNLFDPPRSSDGPAVSTPTPQTPTPQFTPGCTFTTEQSMLNALDKLDLPAHHILILSAEMWMYDGHCGIKISAFMDTPELRAAVAKVTKDVIFEFLFHPSDR